MLKENEQKNKQACQQIAIIHPKRKRLLKRILPGIMEIGIEDPSLVAAINLHSTYQSSQDVCLAPL